MTFKPVLDLINAIPRDLILPPANLYLVIFVGLAIWRRAPRAGRFVAGTGLAALTFLSSTAGASYFVQPLERMTAPLRSPVGTGAQAIVVIAAGRMQRAPEYGDRDIPDYIALARVRYAAHLQRLTGLPVLVSGGGEEDVPGAPGPTYQKADAMATALRDDFGVPVKWIEPRSRDTYENAMFSAALLRADGVTRILLVTDAMHMPRSREAFARAGLDVVSAPTMFFGRERMWMGSWIPSAEGMRRSWYAMYELIGIVWYRVRAAETHAPAGAH
jgi:uncharacterized SAM-binding protein YcdF (DUF218 family)